MSSYYDYGWRPYVPVALRRRQAARVVAELRKGGRQVSPVDIAGRKIATTFWGNAWCRNLESYSDYANRLPRGRTYVRNGSVIDLQLEAGRVSSLVSGTDIYEVEIEIKPLAKKRWTDIKSLCAGQIGSLIELLRGSISKGVMEIVTRPGEGLFPSPNEISLSCSCPDWASMCKHVAATLYGIGARLDDAPELLFALRGVDAAELVATAVDQPTPAGRPQNGRGLDSEDLSAVFGIDVDTSKAAVANPSAPRKRGRQTARAKKGKKGRKKAKKVVKVVERRPRTRATPGRTQRPATVKLPPQRLERLHARAVELVQDSPALCELVQDVQLARGRLYLWWEQGDLMARITPIEPGPLLLETPRGRSWTEIRRGRLATVLRALQATA